MTAPRPNSVKVGWATLRLTWIPEADWPKAARDACGITRVAQGEIQILEYDGAEEPWYREILLHEILHAAHTVSGLGQYPTAPTRTPGEQEEWVSTLLAGPLVSFIRDNPVAMAWLTAP